MNEAQQKDLLAAVQSIARTIGADIAADKEPPERYTRGVSFILGRLLGKPALVEMAGRWAMEYLPEAESPDSALLERRKKRLHELERRKKRRLDAMPLEKGLPSPLAGNTVKNPNKTRATLEADQDNLGTAGKWNCKHCERRYIPDRVWQKFCGIECKKKYHAQLRTELVRMARRIDKQANADRARETVHTPHDRTVERTPDSAPETSGRHDSCQDTARPPFAVSVPDLPLWNVARHEGEQSPDRIPPIS